MKIRREPRIYKNQPEVETAKAIIPRCKNEKCYTRQKQKMLFNPEAELEEAVAFGTDESFVTEANSTIVMKIVHVAVTVVLTATGFRLQAQ